MNIYRKIILIISFNSFVIASDLSRCNSPLIFASSSVAGNECLVQKDDGSLLLPACVGYHRMLLHSHMDDVSRILEEEFSEKVQIYDAWLSMLSRKYTTEPRSFCLQKMIQVNADILRKKHSAMLELSDVCSIDQICDYTPKRQAELEFQQWMYARAILPFKTAIECGNDNREQTMTECLRNISFATANLKMKN